MSGVQAGLSKPAKHEDTRSCDFIANIEIDSALNYPAYGAYNLLYYVLALTHNGNIRCCLQLPLFVYGCSAAANRQSGAGYRSVGIKWFCCLVFTLDPGQIAAKSVIF